MLPPTGEELLLRKFRNQDYYSIYFIIRLSHSLGDFTSYFVDLLYVIITNMQQHSNHFSPVYILAMWK